MTEPSADTRLRDAIAAVIWPVLKRWPQFPTVALVDALLPLVVAEVRSAAATAWDEGQQAYCDDIYAAHGMDDLMLDYTPTPNPYRVEEARPVDTADSCAMCNAFTGRELIAETATSAAFFDSFPSADGHVLVVPKRHVDRVAHLTDAESVDLWRLATSLIADEPDAYTLGINDGKAAGQTVPHVHLHVIPRCYGDVPDPRGGVRWVIPQTAPYWVQRSPARVDQPATPPAAAEIACECCGKRMLGYYLEDDAQLCVQCGDVTAGEGSSS